MEVREAIALRFRRPYFWLGQVLAVTGLLLALSTVAHAAGARFTVEYCDSAFPGGNPPEWAWHNSSSANYTPFQKCATPGGTIGITETGQVVNAPAWIESGLAPTPWGYVESVVISGFASNLQPGNEQSHIYADGWPLDNGGDTPRFFQVHNEYNWFGGNGAGLNLVMTCSAAPCNSGGTIAAHYIAVTEVDPSPPEVAKVEGSLLAGGVMRGHQSLAAEATDLGGGVSRLEMLVNGLSAAPATSGACATATVSNPSYSGIAAISPSPCPAKLAGAWTVATSAPPFHDGANTVQVCASDLATVGSPNIKCSTPQTVTVNNSCVESAVSGGQELSANFAESNGETVTVGYGQGAKVTGLLADNAGDPIPGATICVEAQIEGVPGEPGPIASTTTDVSGQFSYELPPGPNRRVLIGYRHDSFQIGRTIGYAAHSRPDLQIRPGRVHEGDRIKLTGQLPGPAAAGRVVVLQASALHGQRWITFRKATTGPRGGFRATYRFGSTSHTLTYKIRAVVPLQSGYPYAAGHSKPALVKVTTGKRRSRRERVAALVYTSPHTIERTRNHEMHRELLKSQSRTTDATRRAK